MLQIALAGNDHMSPSRTDETMNHPDVEIEVAYPTSDLSPTARATAVFLLDGYYTTLYGVEVRTMSPTDARTRIRQLQASLATAESPDLARATKRAIRDFERICMLREKLR